MAQPLDSPFFEWQPLGPRRTWAAIREASTLIQSQCIVSDESVHQLFHLLDANELPANWLATEYPAVYDQCMNYAGEVDAVRREHERLTAEHCLVQSGTAPGVAHARTR